MADADNGNVDIEIKTKYDGKGVAAAKRGMEQAGKAADDFAAKHEAARKRAERFSQSSEQVQSSLSALSGAVMMVSPRLAGLIQMTAGITNGIKGVGLALKALMSNPYALAIAAIAGAAMSLTNAFKKAKESAVKLYEEGQRNILEQMRDRNIEVADSFKAVSDSVAEAADRMEHLNEVERTRIQNSRALQDAADELKRQRSLAGAADNEERMALEHSFQRDAAKTGGERRYMDAQASASAEYEKADGIASLREGLNLKLKAKEDDIRMVGLMESRARGMAANERKSLFGGDADKIKTYEDEMLARQRELAKLRGEREAIEREILASRREEAQARERGDEINRSLPSLKKANEMRVEAMKVAHDKAEDDARKAGEKSAKEAARSFQREMDGVDRANGDALSAQYRADMESDWRYNFDRADHAGRKRMLAERLGDASADEESAKEAMAKLTEAIKTEADDEKRGELERQLAEERGRYSNAASVRRSSEEALRGMDGRGGFVVGEKLGDRISAIGGFSTAAAKAASGISLRSPERERDENAKRQTEYQKETRDAVKAIARNTENIGSGGGEATFA